MSKIRSIVHNPQLLGYLAWLVALAGFLGSLYFSEILKVIPCTLCWYQRIALYPLALLIPIGLNRGDKGLPFYVLPLSVMGGLIAGYHYLLEMKVVTYQPAFCAAGVSCADPAWIWQGFVTIPLLSFIAFTFISLVMLWMLKERKDTNDE